MRRGLPPVSDRTLFAAYQRVLARTPDAEAQADEAGSVTFAGSYERSLRLAAGFAAAGIGPRQPAALLLDNSLDAVHVWSGLGLGGMVEVPVNTAYKGRFLSHVLNDSGAGLIVIDDGYADRLEAVAASLRGRFRVMPLAELEEHGQAAPAPADAGELMAYMYTSGTTGASKGVLISHAHAYTYASREHQECPRDGDRILVTLPLFHLAGQWYGVYQALIHGLPAFIAPGFSPRRYWDTVRAQGSTVTVMLGAMAELLQQQPPRPDDAANPLELAIMAPLASNVAGFCRRFGLRGAAVYGMSEIGAVLDGPPETVVGGEAGFPRAEYELRVVDAAGQDAPVGEIGELWVRPQDPRLVMRGYHNLPDKTAETLIDGWVHTGDAFRVDADGRFFFADRMKDALRRRGENVSSFEVERVINEYPGVFESAVVGVPAELTEDEIKAVVVAQEGQHVDPVELTRFLVDRLPYFMVPRYLEFAAGLPKTPTQKVHKHLLRDRGVGPGVWDREAAGIVLRRAAQ
jgi:carnitine-CoA ligase